MRAVLLSDLHVRGVEPHVAVTTASVEWVCEQIRALHPDVVVMLGDTFHSFTSIAIPDLSLAAAVYNQLLVECYEGGCELIVLVGNHDQYSRDGTVHSLGMLAMVEGATVINRDFGNRIFSGVRCGFLGYVEEPIPHEPVDVFFGHIPVRGFGSVPVSAEHTAWLPEQVPGKLAAFLGHYHEPEDRGTIHVVGSLTAQSFADPPVDRGIVLLDTHKEPFPLIQRIPNPHTPIYQTVDVREGLDRWIPPDLEWVVRMHLRIRCLETQVDEAARFGAGYLSCQIIPEMVARQVERALVSKGADRTEAVSEYAKARCPEGLDPQKLSDVGIKLLGG